MQSKQGAAVALAFSPDVAQPFAKSPTCSRISSGMSESPAPTVRRAGWAQADMLATRG
jgi:hypothetical protein